VPLLIKIFKQYFLDEPSYENFEKANGFLHRLQHEMQRRKWNELDLSWLEKSEKDEIVVEGL
jgi:hypothetical protein